MLDFVLNDPYCLKRFSSNDQEFQSLAIRAARLGRKEDAAYFFSLSKVPFVGGPAQLIYSAVKTKNIPFLEKILKLYKPVSHRDAQLWDMDFNDVVQFLQSENRKDLLEYFSQAGK